MIKLCKAVQLDEAAGCASRRIGSSKSRLGLSVETQEKLLAEIRDLLVAAVESERVRSAARDATIAESVELQRGMMRLYRRVVAVGAIIVVALLILLYSIPQQ